MNYAQTLCLGLRTQRRSLLCQSSVLLLFLIILFGVRAPAQLPGCPVFGCSGGGGIGTGPGPATTSISTLSLSEGPIGMGFQINGVGFGTTAGTVLIGGVSANIVSWADGAIVVQVPSGLASGSYTLTVNTSSTTTANSSFQVDPPFACN